MVQPEKVRGGVVADDTYPIIEAFLRRFWSARMRSHQREKRTTIGSGPFQNCLPRAHTHFAFGIRDFVTKSFCSQSHTHIVETFPSLALFFE